MRQISKSSRPKSRSAARSRALGLATNRSVAIIGAGRLGTALGLALNAAGYRIELVAAKRPATARRAAKLFGTNTPGVSALQLSKLGRKHFEVINRCALVLIATPDDAIAATAKKLSDLFTPNPASVQRQESSAASRRVVLHTSGALAADVLDPMRGAGFVVGSLHPLVSISEPHSGAESLAHAFFSVEGDPAAIRAAKSLVRDLGGESIAINSSCKALYHAAALTVSPNMTALFDIATEMLGVCGLRLPRARRILLPLVQSTVLNLVAQDPATALTGPFKRGDSATVKTHLAALKAANLPQALSAYVVLGQRSLEMAKRGNRNPRGLDEIARLLSDWAGKSRS